MTGLILLVFIAVIIAFFWTRMRGKMKLNVTGKHWTGAIIVVCMALLLLWASAKHGGGH
jgi:succinate dehydrogenase hydrophobic anchor subunit